MKQQDCIYNPITQVFNDPGREAAVQNIEKQNMTQVLASNKDRALRYEQTYNILNFDNKLKGLEDRQDYPKEKPWYFRPGKDTKADYNILSNKPMKEHHFAAPDQRPGEDPPEVSKFKKANGHFRNHVASR